MISLCIELDRQREIGEGDIGVILVGLYVEDRKVDRKGLLNSKGLFEDICVMLEIVPDGVRCLLRAMDHPKIINVNRGFEAGIRGEGDRSSRRKGRTRSQESHTTWHKGMLRLML